MKAIEQERIRQFTQGDESVFEALFREHYAPLCAFAGKFVGEPETAEELVQELFVQLWQKRGEVKLRGSLRSYLYASVRNSALNHIKHLKVRQSYQNWFQARTPESQESNPLDVAELESNIEDAIAALPDRCREVFLLSRREGLKYAEIAERMGISVKTVEVQMGKALKMLRKSLRSWLPVLALIMHNLKIDDFL